MNTLYMVEDERFKNVIKNSKFKRVPKHVNKIKIDGRFKAMFTEEKFKIKGTKDKRGRDLLITTNEDMKRFYELEDEAQNVVETQKSFDASINESSTDSSLSEFEDDEIEHKWGELDADCPEIDKSTSRLALCNMTWDLLTAKDIFLIFDNLKPIGGLIKDIKIFCSEYGKTMKDKEDKYGPFSVVANKDDLNNLNKVKNIHVDKNDEEEDEEFNIEKLREYQINTMKYAYAIIECDTSETALHLYNECNGLEFEKTANIMDLRFVPDETHFDDMAPEDVLSHYNLEMSITGETEFESAHCATSSIKFNILNNATAKCLSQTKFDLTWDQNDPQREYLLQNSLAPLYSVNHVDQVSKTRSKVRKKAKREVMESILSDVQDSCEDNKKDSRNRLIKNPIHQYLASPSSSSAAEDDFLNDSEGEDENQDEKYEKDQEDGNNAKIVNSNKYEKYRSLLAGFVDAKHENLEKSQSDLDLSGDETSGDDSLTLNKKATSTIQNKTNRHETCSGNKVMEITWEPELVNLTKERIKSKFDNDSEDGSTPWEKYLAKQKEKRKIKKVERINKNSQHESENEDAVIRNKHVDTDEALNNENLDLLMMEDDQFFNKDNKFYSTNNSKKTAKKSYYEEDIAEVDKNDSRFSALRNDPKFALDPSHPNYKTAMAAKKIFNHKQQQKKFGKKYKKRFKK